MGILTPPGSKTYTPEQLLQRLDELWASFTTMNQAFILAYMKTFNGSRAAKMVGAGGNGIGGEERQASEWLKEPTIREYISLRMQLMQMDADEVLFRLAMQARGSFEDFIDIDPVSGLPTMDFKKAEDAGALHLIKKLKPNGRGGWEVELHDPQTALIQIGKFHSLWNEKITIEEDDANAPVDRLEDRAARIAAILNAARTRGAGQTRDDQQTVEPSIDSTDPSVLQSS